MRQFTSILILCLAGSAALVRVEAQQPSSAGRSSGARGAGVREAFLSDLSDMEKKLGSLAEAMPQDKYSWRPAKGVRSVSEVYMHVALTNYYFLSSLGVKPPNGMSEEAEKTVIQKAKVIEALKDSVAFVRRGVTGMSDADLKKTTNVEGQQTTYEGALLIISGHMHEHLGQLIAYARMNGIAPPWS